MSSSEGRTTSRDGESVAGNNYLTAKKEFIQSFFKRASEFTEELLRENERLRFRILELEAEISQRPLASESGQESPGAAALRQLVMRIEDLEQERERLLSRFRSVEEENADYEERFKDIERENNSLANLYVASFQLHSTLDLRELRQVISEILINLIGAKIFAVLLLDEQRGVLVPFTTEGIERTTLPMIAVGEGRIGQAVTKGQAEIGNAPVFDKTAFSCWRDAAIKSRLIDQHLRSLGIERRGIGDIARIDPLVPGSGQDAHRRAGWGFGNTFPAHQGYSHGLPIFRKLTRIDMIFYSSEFIALSSHVGATSGESDHLPVLATLAWQQ